MKVFQTLVAATVILGCAGVANAQGRYAVAPLSGYVCMALNLSPAQMVDNSLVIPLYAGPSASSPQVGAAASILLVKSPKHLDHGFAEVVMFNRKQAWIRANLLMPNRFACVPSVMSDGSFGLG